MLIDNNLGLEPFITIESGFDRLFELAGSGPDDLDHIDLYSCFPSAVEIGAAEHVQAVQVMVVIRVHGRVEGSRIDDGDHSPHSCSRISSIDSAR